MKTKQLTPRNSAPVQRENTATIFRDSNAIAPQIQLAGPGSYVDKSLYGIPFAGDDAE